MKYIKRWGLMYNTQTENLSQHTAECAFLSHFLASVGNVYFHKNYDADKIASYALYHDFPEILTGDLPTPIKNYSTDMRDAYKKIESSAAEKLLESLPDELRKIYEPYVTISGLTAEEKKLLKIADRLCAYIKCIQEIGAGNKEFLGAHNKIRRDIEASGCEEVEYFIQNCLPYFSISLHELGEMV
jgi:5'-deoxynucleotidase